MIMSLEKEVKFTTILYLNKYVGQLYLYKNERSIMFEQQAAAGKGLTTAGNLFKPPVLH